jgi:LysM repeat protein
MLGGGVGSLLHRELVVRKKLAHSVSAWTGNDRDDGTLVVRVALARKATVKKVERALRGQIRRLAYAGPTKSQLTAARSRWLSALVFRTQTNRERARLLGGLELGAGDARLLAREADAFEAVGRKQVRDAVKAHLHQDERSVVAAYPPGWRIHPGAPLQRFHLVHPGENLTAIAKRYQVSLGSLLAVNELDAKKPIHPGQKLKLPAGAKRPQQKPSAQQKPSERPRSGASKPQARAQPRKSSRAQKHQRTSTKLAQPNGKRTQARPGRSGSKRATTGAKPTAVAPKPRVHVVRKNQTLLGIARRYGVKLTELCRANGITSKQPIRPGQRLVIPAKK